MEAARAVTVAEVGASTTERPTWAQTRRSIGPNKARTNPFPTPRSLSHKLADSPRLEETSHAPLRPPGQFTAIAPAGGRAWDGCRCGGIPPAIPCASRAIRAISAIRDWTRPRLAGRHLCQLPGRFRTGSRQPSTSSTSAHALRRTPGFDPGSISPPGPLTARMPLLHHAGRLPASEG
jgi:hypothetical protein